MSRLSLNSPFFQTARLSRRGRSTTRRRNQRFRPKLQALEDRFAPATISWTNPLGGNWGTPSNWDANRVPTASDDVIINQTGISITHSFGIDSVRSLTSQAAVDISGGSLTLGTALSQINDTLTTSGDGTLVLNNATLSGSGAVFNQGTLLAEGSSNLNGALTNAPGAILRVLGNAFSGAGTLTVANGFTNDGLIDLTSTGGFAPATLSVGNGTLTNAPDGLIQASAGTGGQRTLNAQLDNQGSLEAFTDITLDKSSAAQLNEGTINVIGGNMTVNQQSTTATFTNLGTITVESSFSFTIGNGTFTNFSGGVLTGGTFDIAGTLRFPNAAITSNAATIILEGTAAQIVDPTNHDALAGLVGNAFAGVLIIQYGRNFTAPGTFSNAGTLLVGEGSTFMVSGPYNQTAGTTTLYRGTLNANSGINIQQGSFLTGVGLLIGNVQNAGELMVGDSSDTGLLTIRGNYTQTATGILDLKLGGTGPGIYFDQLNVTGTASLDGTLNIVLLDDFMANVGDSFQVLAFGTRTGDFATMNGLDLGDGFYLDPVYDSTGLTLVTQSN